MNFVQIIISKFNAIIRIPTHTIQFAVFIFTDTQYFGIIFRSNANFGFFGYSSKIFTLILLKQECYDNDNYTDNQSIA